MDFPPNNEHQNNYPKPSVSADILVFSLQAPWLSHWEKGINCQQEYKREELSIVLITRKNDPFQGKMAIPGGFVDMHEDIEEAALRELEEETHLTNIPLLPFKTYGQPYRDPRGRTITIAYLTIAPREQLENKLQAGDDAASAKIYPWREAKGLAFDHEQMLKEGQQALFHQSYQSKVLKSILPEFFDQALLFYVWECIAPQAHSLTTLFQYMIDFKHIREAKQGLYCFS